MLLDNFYFFLVVKFLHYLTKKLGKSCFFCFSSVNLTNVSNFVLNFIKMSI